MALITPSMLAADFARLGEALAVIRAAGARRVHVDVMDGHFAVDISVGPPVIESLRKATDMELDVHLLVERPERFVTDFANAGADRIAIHAEATQDLHRALEQVRSAGHKVGLALNPATPIEFAFASLRALDYLLILTADLGLEEGKFLKGHSEKVFRAAQERRRQGLDFEIAAEGGIGIAEVDELVSAGADILVAGSAIFHSSDPKASLRELTRSAAGAIRCGEDAEAQRRAGER